MHSWDTETIDFDIKEQSPVHNGKIICAQMFCGPDAEFADGPMLFVDNFGDAHDTILHFKDYFQNDQFKKCWFNYGFDRHVFMNHGIDVRGFAGDVMHMARLLDPSRDPKEYSLARVSKFYESNVENFKQTMFSKMKQNPDLTPEQRKSLNLYNEQFLKMQKVPMNKLFARRKRLQNGSEGKTFEVS